jgi:hypothetical protein
MQPLLSQLEQPRKLVLIEDVLRADVYFAFANNPKGLELKACLTKALSSWSVPGNWQRLNCRAWSRCN